jgi:hypothetical protein
MKALAALSLLSLSLAACAGAGMKPHYSKSVVQPVVVKKISDDAISIRYRVFPETSYYSKGVNYEAVDGALRIYIDRCSIQETCKPMAETSIPLDAKWEAEVRVPYHQEKVILVHSDEEEQIYP